MRKSKRKASKRRPAKRKASKRRTSKRKASKSKVWPDRLSELPDSLILQILSLLEMREVVKTTLLSKRWKDLWTTIPCLDFRNDSSNLTNSVTFMNFVSGALALWKGGKILKFSLRFRFDLSIGSDILDSWLFFAVEKQVEELYISLYSKREYCPPQFLNSCSSITKLSLSFYQLEIEANVNVQWNQLKSLSIFCINPLSEHVVKQILCGAPRLELLNLDFAESSESLNIESGCLKMLRILRGPRISRVPGADKAVQRIRAPNLEMFEIMCLLEVPSLIDAVLGFEDPFERTHSEPGLIILFEEMLRQDLPSIFHVEQATFSYWCSKALVEMKKDMLIQFPKAKFLKFYPSAAGEILGFLEMFPELTTLTLKHKDLRSLLDPMSLETAKVYTELKTVHPNPSLLHLREVEITWLLHDIGTIIPLIKFLLQNALLLEKMVLRPKPVDGNQLWLSLVEENLLSMPRSSPTVEVIIIKD